MDSVSPETPIRDVVDRCCVWESHADPVVRRIGKPNTDPTYPTYGVGDSDSDNETTRETREAVVTGQIRAESSGGLAKARNFDRGVSGSEAGGVRRRKTDTEAGKGDTESTTRSYRPSSTDDIGTDVTLFPQGTAPTTATAYATMDVVCFSCGKSSHMTTRCPNLNEAYPFLQPGWRTEKTFVVISPRQLIREGGSASQVSDHARPRDPGGGTVPTVSPRRTIIDDVSQPVGQSGGGGGAQLVFPGVRQCGLNRLRLRTLQKVSVLMMLLDYEHMMARCGCRMIECRMEI